MSYSKIADRNTSSFPLSIGTGLAFESVFKPTMPVYDTSRVVPNKIDLSRYNDSYISIFTLYRNMVGSLSPIALAGVTISDLVDSLLQEMEVIRSLYLQEGGGVIVPTFYIMSYDDIWSGKWSSSAILKKPNTINQKDFSNRYLAVIKQLKKLITVPIYNTEIRPKRGSKAFILTHMSIDLLSHTKFKTLDLLESNTGKLKTPNTWSSKFNKVNNEYQFNLPFNKTTLVLFGDRNILKPYSNKIRNTILDVARSKRWTSATTIAKVKLDLSIHILDPYLNKIISEI